jgi:signal transduction histidine kinase
MRAGRLFLLDGKAAGAGHPERLLRRTDLRRAYDRSACHLTALASEHDHHLAAVEAVALHSAKEFPRKQAPPGTSEARAAALLSRDLYGLLDSVEDAVLLVDQRGCILFRNQSAASLIDDAASLRRSYLADCRGEPWQRALHLLAEACDGRASIAHKLTVQDSSGFWALWFQELQNSVPGARRYAILVRNVTSEERQRQEWELSHCMARVGVLLGGGAHQAKNVLFGLSATLDALQEAHSASLDERDPHIRHLRDGIARMEAMLRNVFAQSRPRGKYLPLCVRTVLCESIRGCASLAYARDVNICTGGSSDLLVPGDLQPLVQAMENLIDNAVRHSPQGSTVTVDVHSAAGDRSRIAIHITDHGPGFRVQDIQELFTPFFSRRPGGTGLGLPVARHIVEEHGGSIVIANGKTGGAVVTVFLPAICDSGTSSDNITEAR